MEQIARPEIHILTWPEVFHWPQAVTHSECEQPDTVYVTIQRWMVTALLHYIYCSNFSDKLHFCDSHDFCLYVSCGVNRNSDCSVGLPWLGCFSFYSCVILLIYFTLRNCFIWSQREFCRDCAPPITRSRRCTVASLGQSQSPQRLVDAAVRSIAEGGPAAIQVAAEKPLCWKQLWSWFLRRQIAHYCFRSSSLFTLGNVFFCCL